MIRMEQRYLSVDPVLRIRKADDKHIFTYKSGMGMIRQEEEKATYAPIIVKEDGLIDWNRPAQDIDRMIRGFHVWPGAYSFFEDKKLTLLEARIREAENPSAIPGTILAEEATGKKPKFLVQTGDGILEITKLQLQGKKAMAAADFLRGVRQIPEKLGVINDLV